MPDPRIASQQPAPQRQGAAPQGQPQNQQQQIVMAIKQMPRPELEELAYEAIMELQGVTQGQPQEQPQGQPQGGGI